jgi:hypothetical protein
MISSLQTTVKTKLRSLIRTNLNRFGPEGTHKILGRELHINRSDSADSPFEGARDNYTMGEYVKASLSLYKELGDEFFSGIHPSIATFKPKCSSWIPYVAGQTHAFIHNYPGIQYSLNNPFIIVARFVLYRDGAKVVDQSFTRVVLPQSSSYLDWPKSFNEKLCDGDTQGRLIVYTFDPLFKPFPKQFRFFGLYKSDGLVRCGVHSWPQTPGHLHVKIPSLQSRNKIPSPQAGEDFKYFQEVYASEPCTANKCDDHSETLPKAFQLALANRDRGFTAGFLGTTTGKNLNRIWHDNAGYTTFTFPKTKLDKSLVLNLVFFIPPGDFYAKVIINNPLTNNLSIGGDSIRLSALHSDGVSPFHQADIALGKPLSDKQYEAYEIDLQDFLENARKGLRSQDEFIQVNLSVTAEGSDFSIENIFSALNAQVFMYSRNGQICDQFHTGTSASHILNPVVESPRTNKFGPVYIDDHNSTYIVINNEFPDYLVRGTMGFGVHKLKISLHLNNDQEAKVRFLTTSLEDNFYALNVSELFGLEPGKTHVGTLQLFCATANFWTYYMNVGKSETDRSLSCDHFSGG